MTFRKFRYYLLPSTAFLLISLAVSLVTPLGTQIWCWLISQSPAIELEYQSGSVLDELILSQASWQQQGLLIRLTQLHLKLELPCLWQGKLCIERLSAQRISIKQTDELSTPDNENSASTAPIHAPMAIEVANLVIADLDYQAPDVQLKVKHISTAVRFVAQTVTLAQPKIQTIDVHLTEQTAAKTRSTAASNSAMLLPNITLPVTVLVDGLLINRWSLTQAKQQYIVQQLQFSGAWRTSLLTLEHCSLVIAELGQFKAQGDLHFAAPFSTALTINTDLKQFAWWPQLVNSQQEIKLSGDWSNLQAQVTSVGSVALTSQLQFDLSQSHYPFTIDLQASKLPVATQIHPDVIPSSISLHASGDLQQQDFSLQAELTGFGYQQAKIKLTGQHQQQTLTVQQVEFTDVDSASELSITGVVAYGDKLTWQINALSSGFELPKMLLTAETPIRQGRIEGKFNSTGFWQQDDWQFSLNDTKVSGQVNEIPVLLDGDVSYNKQGVLRPGKLTITANDSQLTVQGYSDQQWHLAGHLSVPKLEYWLTDTRGQLKTDFTVTGAIDAPLLTLSSELKHFFRQQLASPLLNVTGQIALSPTYATKLQLSAEHFSLAEQALSQLSVQGNGDLQQQQLSANWQGELAGQFQLAGLWSAKTGIWQGSINDSKFSYRTLSLQPEHNIDLIFDTQLQQATIAQHCWHGEGVELCLPNAQRVGLQGQLQLELALTSDFVNQQLMPKEIEFNGDILGKAKLDWHPTQAITAAMQLKVANGYLQFSPDNEQKIDWRWSSADAELSYQQHLFSGSMSVLNGKSQAEPLLLVRGKLDVTDEPSIDSEFILSSWNIAPLRGFLANVTNLKGEVSGHVTATGALAQPQLNGVLRLQQGELSVLGSSSTVQQTQASLTLNGQQASLDGQFSINDQPAYLSGSADWQQQLSADLALSASQLAIDIPPALSVTVAPNLHAHWQNSVVKISGNIDLLAGVATIESLPEGSIDVSQDVVIVNDAGQPLEQFNRAAIATDVQVNVAPKFKVQGQGFVGYLSGALSLQQQPRQPLQLFGSLAINNGVYKAYGQNLTIDNSDIAFNGSLAKPYLNIQATRAIKTEEKSVGIKLQGVPDALALTLFSEPVMEQNEILSYLLRGRGLDAGTASNSSTGYALAISLTNSTGWLKKLDKLPLLNNVELDTQGDGNKTQATISGYLGERTYLKYGVGVFEPINELTVRFYLLNRLWLEAVSSLENSVDIYYSFDVD